MTTIDDRLERLARQRRLNDVTYQMRRQEEIAERQRRAYLDSKSAVHLPPTVVLVPWHRDEAGNRCRSIGCEATS